MIKKKIKHNKKRNTAFLYESLVREIAKNIVKKDDQRRNYAVSLIKEYFKLGTELAKELELYKILNTAQDLNPIIAEKLIQETKRSYKKIDKKKLYIEQSKFISKINRNLSKKVFSNFVPNYKSLATIAQIFNDDVSIKTRVLLEAELLKLMTEEKNKLDKKVPITNLVYRTFIKKFNEAYGNNTLLEEQRTLLQKYVSSLDNNGVQLKLFLNEEITRLKSIINNSLKDEEIKLDQPMIEKTNKVLSLIENFRTKPIDNEMLVQIMRMQNLAKEIQE